LEEKKSGEEVKAKEEMQVIDEIPSSEQESIQLKSFEELMTEL
jgi:hypothetical protein